MTPDLVREIWFDELTRDRARAICTWDFEPEGRTRLARTLELLYELIPEPFRFSSLWIGDESTEREIGRAELLAIIRDDEVGTHMTYLVRGADQERFTR